MLADRVGLPIEPPRRNVNSGLALETQELVRARSGDEASERFHHAISRAFFAEGEDIAQLAVVAPRAAAEGVGEDEVRSAWSRHEFAGTIADSMRASQRAGVHGVPAYGWPGTHAISGMMEPERIVVSLRTIMPRR